MIRNLPTTQETPAITKPRLRELALADATRTQARTKKTALTTRTDELNSDNWGLANRLERRTVFTTKSKQNPNYLVAAATTYRG